MSEFKFEIIEHFAQLNTSAKGWSKELTRVSWNERDPKYDIREWSPDYTKMGKGVTFTTEELRILRDALNQMDL
ncbi:hypothetical protein HZY86_07205 [Aerococcaceae bacterium DSM 111020]|nr:hypothetical protein [Aerococcaceae bacterium DSM 111020]